MSMSGQSLLHSKWQRSGLVIIAALLSFNSMFSFAERGPLSGKERVLQAIEDYQVQPISKRGFELAGQIIEFAEQSDKVLVEVNPDTTPWLLNNRLPDSLRGALLGAYVSGNIKPQLQLELKKAHHCEGALEVKRVLSLIVNAQLKQELELANQLNENSLANFNCVGKPADFI